jgi:deoxyribodipyrimidine photolyase
LVPRFRPPSARPPASDACSATRGRHSGVHLACNARTAAAGRCSSGDDRVISACSVLSYDARSQAWLEESLESLDKSLTALGSCLILRGTPSRDQVAGDAASELVQLAAQIGATAVFYHRAYTPCGSSEQDAVDAALASHGVHAESFEGHLLYEPSRVDMGPGYSGGHWGTLMPFLRACERSGPSPPLPLPPPSSLCAPRQWPASMPLSSLGLAAAAGKASAGGMHWAKKIMSHWRVGECAALEMMEAFVRGHGLARYEFDRSCADKQGAVSSLSPYVPSRFAVQQRHSRFCVSSQRCHAATCASGSCRRGSCITPSCLQA